MARLKSVLKLRDPGTRRSARWALSRAVNRASYRYGLALMSDHFYQPLPARDDRVGHRVHTPKVEQAVASGSALLDQLIDAFAGEFDAALVAARYEATSSQVSRMDAMALYGLLRSRKPSKVTEIGSGTSSRIIVAALARNSAETGRKSDFISIDPYSDPAVGVPPPGVSHTHLAVPVQSAPASCWTDLGPSDVLFVDSSHVYKAASDVEFEFLHIYPALRRGVLLHVHDVFLPLDYPEDWDLRESRFWNEQHVLAAVIENSDRYGVLLPLAAIAAQRQDLVADARADGNTCPAAGSIWMSVS